MFKFTLLSRMSLVALVLISSCNQQEGFFQKSGTVKTQIRETQEPGSGGGSPTACNFVKACEKGTHADYASCSCVPDEVSQPCPIFKCAAPPEGCHYEQIPSDSVNECPSGCGILKCEPKIIDECPPVPDCAAPPRGCVYQMQYDTNGCVIGCGPLVCKMPPEDL